MTEPDDVVEPIEESPAVEEAVDDETTVPELAAEDPGVPDDGLTPVFREPPEPA
jgi:hypothetical protein